MGFESNFVYEVSNLIVYGGRKQLDQFQEHSVDQCTHQLIKHVSNITSAIHEHNMVYG